MSRLRSVELRRGKQVSGVRCQEKETENPVALVERNPILIVFLLNSGF